jgi:hypothetical protein
MLIMNTKYPLLILLFFITIKNGCTPGTRTPHMLNADSFQHHIDYFNQMEEENIINHIPNEQSWEWMKINIPFFECPDKKFEQIYYFRWWTLRKHIKHTPDGFVFTEFLAPVSHAGKYNTISCAVGHHLYEGRWLHNQQYLDEYMLFWYRGNNGEPQEHFHSYSNWATDALYNRFLVNLNKKFLTDLLSDFVMDYEKWEQEKLLPDGLFWQYDVRDGMEESISGSRTKKNTRPTINSYMYANAVAIAKIAAMAGDETTAKNFANKAKNLKKLIQENLWDPEYTFYKVRHENGQLADVREELGLIPWYFNLPDPGYEQAWQQILDPEGFLAPLGLTTAERRHPEFRSHGVGTCEWDGAVWPFATGQSLTALANVLRNYAQNFVTKEDYFAALLTYANSHNREGKPYIGEYLDEKTGVWLTPDSDMSRYYNHSTFNDLVITGLVGLLPREDNQIEIYPLLPENSWDWFCLDNVQYHDQNITILWDRHGEKYNRGTGLRIYANGKEIAKSEKLAPMSGLLLK